MSKAQERQDKVACEFLVLGASDWRECLAGTVKLSPAWAKLCGAEEVPIMTYVGKEAEMNQESVERSVVIAFLNRGYQLEELEVEFDGSDEEKAWGISVWYKDHPNYQIPIPKPWAGTIIDHPPFYWATFKTEHAGDQKFGFYSMQMLMCNFILPHKTFVYRKVVFSLPQQKSESEAA